MRYPARLPQSRHCNIRQHTAPKPRWSSPSVSFVRRGNENVAKHIICLQLGQELLRHDTLHLSASDREECATYCTKFGWNLQSSSPNRPAPHVLRTYTRIRSLPSGYGLLCNHPCCLRSRGSPLLCLASSSSGSGRRSAFMWTLWDVTLGQTGSLVRRDTLRECCSPA